MLEINSTFYNLIVLAKKIAISMLQEAGKLYLFFHFLFLCIKH